MSSWLQDPEEEWLCDTSGYMGLKIALQNISSIFQTCYGSLIEMNNSLEIHGITAKGILSLPLLYWHGVRSRDSGTNLGEREISQVKIVFPVHQA